MRKPYVTCETQGGGAASSRAVGAGTLFGVPLGDLGWFTSLLMGCATGFAAFFAATFCGIVGIMTWNSTHGAGAQIDYALSYRRVGFPAGVAVMAAALGYLGTLWVKRMLRKA